MGTDLKRFTATFVRLHKTELILEKKTRLKAQDSSASKYTGYD